jgi:hypothetical protein
LTLKKNELCRIFLLPDNWLKFDDEKKESFLKSSEIFKFLGMIEIFSLIFGIVVVVFADDDAKDLLIEALIW